MPALARWALGAGAVALVAAPALAWQGPRLVSKPAPVGALSRSAQRPAMLPVSFEVNQGQSDPRVRFISRGRGATLFLTDTEAVLALRTAAATASVRMSVVGARPAARPEGMGAQAALVNDLHGAPGRARAGIPTFAEVAYRSVLPGVDLVFHGRQAALEYDLLVGPGVDPEAITLAFSGASGLSLGPAGELVLQTPAGAIRHGRPVLHQDLGGSRRPVSGGYVLRGHDRVGFVVGRHDPSLPLVIDPTLSWSTTLATGASPATSSDLATAVAVDASGNTYVTGSTTSTNFPTTAPAGFSPYQSVCGTGVSPCVGAIYSDGVSTNASTTYTSATAAFSAADLGSRISGTNIGLNNSVAAVNSATSITLGSAATASGSGLSFDIANRAVRGDAFVAKLDSGGALVYSTYLGGSGNDTGTGVAVDASGNAYVTGSTTSSDFPTTAGALSGSYGGGGDAFVAKLNSTGSALVYSTYLGGSGSDQGNAIAVDAANHAHLTGVTCSSNFPTTSSAFQTAQKGVCDAFVSELNSSGGGLVYSTYLGGAGQLNNGIATGYGLALDGSSVWVTGSVNFWERDFPTTPDAYRPVRLCSQDLAALDPTGQAVPLLINLINDALPGTIPGCSWRAGFLTKLTPGRVSGQPSLDIAYSTYLGQAQTGHVEGFAVAVSSARVYVTGYTNARDFPSTAGVVQAADAGGADAFVMKFDPSMAGVQGLVYSTYLGGVDDDRGRGIAVDSAGDAFVVGWTGATSSSSGGFPTTSSSVSFPATGGTFVSELNPGGSALVSSVRLTGPGSDGTGSLALDAGGRLHVAGGVGADAFVAEIAP